MISGFLILALFIPIQENGIAQWIFVIIFSYLIGIIYHRLLELIRKELDKYFKWKPKLWLGTIFIRNYKKAIEQAKEDNKKERKKNDEYYTAYDSIIDKHSYSTLNILEAQEAFLRNTTWILLFYLFSYLGDDKNIIPFWLMLLLFVFIFLARYQTQKKVYEAVWYAGNKDNEVGCEEKKDNEVGCEEVEEDKKKNNKADNKKNKNKQRKTKKK